MLKGFIPYARIQKDSFNYFGSIISNDGEIDENVGYRIKV